MTFSIRVVDSDGRPRDGVRVTADFGLLNGQLTEVTDDDGWVTLEPAGDYVTAEFFIAGESQGAHGIEDGETFSFTLD